MIFSLGLYKHHLTRMWIFDDPHRGLHQEPFIRGADLIIDSLVSGILNADAGFNLEFSAQKVFPDMTRLELLREEDGGATYWCAKFQLSGWLCPALFKFYPVAPPELFVKALPRPPGVRPFAIHGTDGGRGQ